MKRSKNKTLRNVIIGICVVALVALLAVFPMLAGGKGAGSDGVSILQDTVKNASLTRRILGGGTLTEEDAVELTVPAEVRLTEFLVKNGVCVKTGDPIARADRTSVMQAISQIQETMNTIAKDIQKESEKSNTATVTAQVGGTVKVLYARPNDTVRDVMLRHGALAVLTLDGKMAVSLPFRAGVAAGEAVEVTLEKGQTVTGKVESNLNDTMVISFPDESFALGQTVSVAMDGEDFGSGSLYILNPWKAVAYSGTVEEVNVKEGQHIESGKKLLKLKDTGYTAAYQQLCSEYREYEDIMLELFTIYQTRLVTAPCDGIVSDIDKDSALLLADTGSGYTFCLLANAPFGEDPDALYHNYLGVVVTPGETEWEMLMDPTDLPVADYLDLTGIAPDKTLMTQQILFPKDLVPVYEAVEGVWQQIDPTTVATDDVLLIACDDEGNFIWAVRLLAAEPPVPDTPNIPDIPNIPNIPNIPSYPSFPNMGGITFPNIGDFSQYSQGGLTLPQEDTLYPMDTALVASVTPQDTMTLDITLDQKDMGNLYVGQTVSVTVDALTGKTFQAKVDSLGNSGTSNGGSSKFTVTLTLPRQENMLGGMQASAAIELDSIRDVPTVPVAALAEVNGTTVIYTGYNEETGELLNPVAVTTGLSDGENVQILTGLSLGDSFFYAYYDTLKISDAAKNSFSGLF